MKCSQLQKNAFQFKMVFIQVKQHKEMMYKVNSSSNSHFRATFDVGEDQSCSLE